MQKTKITQKDLQIHLSERLTDTDDGGGQMTNRVLTGADNELFPPVSDVDRTMGSFDVRLVYPAVIRADAEPLYGAHVMISEPARADNVSFLLVKAGKYNEKRREIMARIEAYSVPTTESRMVIFGYQNVNSRMIQTIQEVDDPLPRVGERYCLRTFKGKPNQKDEYFRIKRIADEVRRFNDDKGDYFKRVIKLETFTGLKDNYQGLETRMIGRSRLQLNEVQVMETQVADTAQYYGIQRLQEPVTAGSLSAVCASVFAKLVPTSQIETPFMDEYVSGAMFRMKAGTVNNIEKTPTNYYASQTITAPLPIFPGSLSMGEEVDADAGTLRMSGWSTGLDYSIAASLPTISHSAAIFIDETTQGFEYVPLLRPRPAWGTVSVSYLSQGNWYHLNDYNTPGKLKDDSGVDAGEVSVDGSVRITCKGLPDVGSRIVIHWANNALYSTVNGEKNYSDAEFKQIYALNVQPLRPGYVKLIQGETVNTDDGAGNIGGDFPCFVDYQKAELVFAGDAVLPEDLQVEYMIYSDDKETLEIPVSNVGGVLTGNIGESLPGSVSLRADVAFTDKDGRGVAVDLPPVTRIQQTAVKFGMPFVGGFIVRG